MESKQARVMLWSTSRSLSTAFYRAITNSPDTLGIFEPYFEALPYGTEENLTCKANTSEHTGTIYHDIKKKLEKPYTDYRIIFVKALAFRFVVSHCKIEEILPEGFTHTFLIRNPRKTVSSMYRMFVKREVPGWTVFDKSYGEMKQLYELYTYLTNKLGITCLIVDADDLEENPEAVLTKYCDFVGIPFHTSMIDWTQANPSSFAAFREAMKKFSGSFFDTAANATSFRRSTNGSLDVSNYPPIVHETIEEHMPYYEYLQANRVIIC